MYQFIRMAVSGCLVALAGCEGSSIGQPENPVIDEPLALIAPQPDAPTVGSIGPVQYGFAPERLTRAEIQLELPPRFDKAVWATKLISVERGPLLGGQSCRYGGSARPQTCTSEREDGLALALLERPIADYRQRFLDHGIHKTALSEDTQAGAAGFCFTAVVTGSGMDYCYYDVSDQTLLIARRFSERGAPIDPAIGQVLDSLHIPSMPGKRTS